MPSPSKQKQRGDKYHLRNEDVDEDDKSLQTCVELNVRILWRLHTSKSLPTPPDDDAMAHFEQNFTTADDIDKFVASLKFNHKDAKKKIRAFRNDPKTIGSRSHITKNIAAMNDVDLGTIYASVIVSGINNWNPDIFGSPDSLYNVAHERIAITTFQNVAANHGYSRLSPNLTNLEDRVLLTKFYRNFVFSYMLRTMKAEVKSPGRLEQVSTNKNIYSRRTRLADNRTVYIIESGYPKAVQSLSSQPECNSDDEAIFRAGTQEVTTYLRKKKIARSEKVETWMRGVVDPARMKKFAAQGLTAQVKEERKRAVDPNDTTGTDISQRIPGPGVALDWFDPEYFNEMPAAIRQAYVIAGSIALPLEEHLSKKDWKTMSAKAFMKKYGDDVAALYDVPTEEEMANADGDDEDEDEGEGSQDQEDMDEDL
ncbi:hypothetical protein FB451DRAFT_1415275 [Mycena latifolia]|nr:hypothetical protein FB451DRAFT_1415275 [Mycena latifolia]